MSLEGTAGNGRNRPQPHRIDTHHHILPPPYLSKERDRIRASAPNHSAQAFDWSPAKALEAMDRAGIATAVTSISAPGIGFGDAAESRRMARECNEFAARMASDHRGRFGVFAALPLPDVDGSLREIEYALDVLKADGVGLMTHYGDLWPGDARLAPVFEELEPGELLAVECDNALELLPQLGGQGASR